jgi:hypothetical protein
MVRVKDLALMACLMITMAVTTADIEFGGLPRLR